MFEKITFTYNQKQLEYEKKIKDLNISITSINDDKERSIDQKDKYIRELTFEIEQLKKYS